MIFSILFIFDGTSVITKKELSHYLQPFLNNK